MARASVLQRFHVDAVRATGRTVGSGAHATVNELGLKCVSKRPHLILFEQARPEQNADMLRLMEEDCKLLSQLRHPNIVQCFGVHLDKSSQLPAFVMEYLPTSLRAALDGGRELPMVTKYGILSDVAFGLCYLHGHDPPIIHRDLSADTVFLTSNFSAKISCVSMAKMLQLDPPKNAAPRLRPPEVLAEADSDCTTKVDIYYYGLLILDVLNGRQEVPLSASRLSDSGISDMSFPGMHEDGYSTHCVTEPLSNGHPLSELVRQCLCSEHPSDRPEAADILQHLSDVMPALSTADCQQLAESEDDVDTFQLHVENTQSSGGLKRDNERLTRELRAMKRENHRLRDDIQTVSTQNEQLTVTVKEIHITNQRMGNEMRCPKEQQNTTQNENLLLKEAVNGHETHIQDMETAVCQLGQDLAKAKQMCQSLEHEKEGLIRERTSLAHQLDVARSENKRLELEVKEKHEQTAKLEELQCETQTLTQEVDAIKSKNQEMEDQLASVTETGKNEIQMLRQKLEAENTQLRQQSAKASQRLEEVNNDNERLRLDHKSHKREVEWMQTDHAETIKKLQRETEANEKLKQEIKTAMEKINEVEQQLAHEKEEKQRLAERTKASQREVQQSVEAAMASLRQDMKEARSEFLGLTHDIKIDVSHCLQKLRERVKRLGTEN